MAAGPLVLAPGVSWNDVAMAPPPRLLTGVPAFLGYAPGEAGGAGDRFDEPHLVTRWPEAERLVSSTPNGSYLAPAVRGFFENGGLMCYVVRLRDAPVETAEALRRGLEALTPFDGVDLICVPDLMRGRDRPDADAVGEVAALQQPVLDHCRIRGDRFAILDALNTEQLARPGHAGDAAGRLSSVSIEDQRAGLRDGSSGALYHPWLLVPDGTGRPVTVPPCGHVAGVFARTDLRVGVHKAPANEVLEGVLDLRHHLSPAGAGLLHGLGVNGIRSFPGRGTRIWGARTLGADQDPRVDQVNVRRLFITMARWLEQFLASVAFEPNDLRLWLRIMREVSAYCEDLFRRGALSGRVAEEAFYVKCDSDTNPPEVIEAGMVVTEVGLAPMAPAEFVVVRITHGENGVSLSPLDSRSQPLAR
jgi:uncharacterized protein